MLLQIYVVFRVCKGLWRRHLTRKMKGIAKWLQQPWGWHQRGPRTRFSDVHGFYFLYKLPLVKKSTNTLLKINIFHLGNRKIIFKTPLGRDMLVPRREIQIPRIHSEDFHPTWNGIKCVTNSLLLSIRFLKVSSTNYQLYSPSNHASVYMCLFGPFKLEDELRQTKKDCLHISHLFDQHCYLHSKGTNMTSHLSNHLQVPGHGGIRSQEVHRLINLQKVPSQKINDPKNQRIRTTCSWWFFTNPFEKYCVSQIGSWNPKFRDENSKNI